MQIIVVAIAATVLGLMAGSAKADDLPTPARQGVGAFQAACSAENGFKSFSRQVLCIKGLIARSGDYGTQPEVTLYALQADELVEEVRAGRLSPAAARVQLQKAYLALLDSEQARTAEQKAQAAQEEAARAAVERERRAAQAAEEARQAALQQRELERTAGVQNCINLVRQRREAQYQGPGGPITKGLIVASGDPVERNCANNPNAYQALPPPPVVVEVR